EDFIGVSGFWRERRCWLNGQSLSKHHTLELRLPEGTTDADRIRGWVNLFLVCIEGVLTAYSKNPVRSVRTAFKS
ncbi:hypothetical protein DWA27_19760, partial [Acinetobacter baumannii]|uniref:amidoligase family protein n=1 Tax=Acinetobacter baumannii TaxID=470 RepID=UPI0010D07FF0